MTIPSASRDFFKKYWRKPAELDKRIGEMERFVKKVDSIYSKMIHSYISDKPAASLLSAMGKIVNSAWTANAIAFFSLHFDKSFCLELLQEVQSSISEKRLNSFWDEAIIPVSDSLENRHKIMVLELLKKKLSWQKISELCQFFKATYYNVATPKETGRLFQEELGDFVGKENSELIILEKEQNERNKKYKKFLSGLSEEEKKLVSYIQRIIELRDQRKDFTAKASTIMFRVAQRMLKESGVPDNLRLYITFGEFIRGFHIW